jgi:glycosyltransferase involved in cell wall biosynthesis
MTDINRKKAKVSICIVTFNHARYIKDCLVSVLMQRQDALIEILVGDDCSTDDTGRIVQLLAEEHPGCIRFFCHRKKKGPSENIRYLIEQADGDYIAHLDGDDFWLPGKLERQLQFMESHEACSAVYTNAIVVDKDNTLIGVFNNRQPEIQDVNYLLRRGNYLNHSSMLYRSRSKKSILAIRGRLLDYRIHCCLALQGGLGYLNSTLVAYRLGASGSLVSTTPDVVRIMLWETLQEMRKATVYSDALLDSMSHFLGHIFFDSFLRRRPSYAIEWIKRIRHDIADNFYRILLFGIMTFIKSSYKALLTKILSTLSNNRLRVIHYR